MTYAFRVLALLFVIPAVYFFIYWVPFSLVDLDDGGWIRFIVSLLCATGVGWFVWTRLGTARSELISSVSLGASLVGGIGFCGGFFGPMIFAPGANQGPLLGLFITGPAGFFLGAVGGLISWWLKRKSDRQFQGAASFLPQEILRYSELDGQSASNSAFIQSLIHKPY